MDTLYDIADASKAGGGFVPDDVLARWRTLGSKAAAVAADTAWSLGSESEQYATP